MDGWSVNGWTDGQTDKKWIDGWMDRQWSDNWCWAMMKYMKLNNAAMIVIFNPLRSPEPLN